MSFKVLQDANIANYKEIIEEFSKKVEKQYALEKKLNEMIDNLK
jgi:hypothetical protein